MLALLPGLQPIALAAALGAFLFTLIPGIQELAIWVFALAF
jgi:hypothetical protein